MKQRHLGSLTVSSIGLGCMGLSQGYGPTSRDEAVTAIHVALEAGVTLFDTAMSYGEGANEELVGTALGSAGLAGAKALVATKAGIVRTPEGVRVDARPDRLRGDALASVRRLDRDVIDLYYLHRVDPRFPVEEQVGALADLVDEGLVRAVGVSEVTATQLEAATSTTTISAVQLEWSLAWRAAERDVIPAARRLGVPVVAYSPLGRGLLTADPASRDPSVSAFRGSDPRFDSTHRGPNLLQRSA